MSTYQKTHSAERQAAYEERKATEARLVEDYKANINLTAYLVDRGWKPIKGKHTQNWAALEEEATGRKVIIHRANASGHYAYKSFEDERDKGTIINMVGQELKLDLGTREGWVKLHAHLSPMVGNVYAPDQQIRPTTQKDFPKLDESAIINMLDLQPLQNRAWLHSRHIDDQTIDAPEFKGQIAQRPFKAKSGYEVINTAFPMRNMDHLVTANTRDLKHNMLVGPKNDALWMSNIVAGVRPREIVIVENPLDALSHRQLYPPGQPGERLYLGSAGQPGGLQIGTVQRIIDRIKPERVVLGNDNDFSGIRFNIQYMGELKMPQQPASPWKAYLTSGNQKTQAHNQLRLTAPQGVDLPQGQSPQIIAQRLEKLLNSGHLVDETKAVITIGKTYQGDTEITASIPNNRSMLTRAENAVKEFRQTGELMVVKRSFEKDFNDDLKADVIKRAELVERIKQNRPESMRDRPVDLTPDWLKKFQIKANNDRIQAEKETPKIKYGPTGLPMTDYRKGETSNKLPDDGDIRASRTPKPDQPTKEGQTKPKPQTTLNLPDSPDKPERKSKARPGEKSVDNGPITPEPAKKLVLGYVETSASGERNPVLVAKNPYVLASTDGKFTLGIDRNERPVLETGKAVPTQFDAQSADYLLREFKADRSQAGEQQGVTLHKLTEAEFAALGQRPDGPKQADVPQTQVLQQAFVVTSNDGRFTLDLNEKKQPVLLENARPPGRFSEELADHLVTVFKPAGGQILTKMPEAKFHTLRVEQLGDKPAATNAPVGVGKKQPVGANKATVSQQATPIGASQSRAGSKDRPVLPPAGPGASSPALKKAAVKANAGAVGEQKTTTTRSNRR